jgi:hypothetical protein
LGLDLPKERAVLLPESVLSRYYDSMTAKCDDRPTIWLDRNN